MSFLKDLIAINCLTQGILIYLYFKNINFFDALFIIYQTNQNYFWFLTVGLTSLLWLIWGHLR